MITHLQMKKKSVSGILPQGNKKSAVTGACVSFRVWQSGDCHCWSFVSHARISSSICVSRL